MLMTAIFKHGGSESQISPTILHFEILYPMISAHHSYRYWRNIINIHT